MQIWINVCNTNFGLGFRYMCSLLKERALFLHKWIIFFFIINPFNILDISECRYCLVWRQFGVRLLGWGWGIVKGGLACEVRSQRNNCATLFYSPRCCFYSPSFQAQSDHHTALKAPLLHIQNLSIPLLLFPFRPFASFFWRCLFRKSCLNLTLFL